MSSSRARATLAGVLSVGFALGISEFFAGLFTGVPSLVASVGSIFIPFIPPALEDFAIETFGTSDKFVLYLTTVVGTLAFGAWAGRVAWTNVRGAAGIWTGFTLIGLLAASSQPLVSTPLTLALLIAASVGGYAVLTALRNADRTLLRLIEARDNGGEVADRRAEVMVDLSRRRFVGMLSGVGIAGLVAAATGRALLNGQARVNIDALTLPAAQRTVPVPGAAAAFDVPGISPIVVPNEDFYRIDTALTIPRVDPETWSMLITGMVDREVELTYGDILDMDLVEAYVTLSCVSNRVGGDLVGNAKWLGVPLANVLDLAGVQPGADQLVGRSVDGWTGGFPTELAFDGRDALLAVGMNDEPLPASHGFPARLVIPGLYGYVSATKWIREIELTTWDAFDAYWVPRGWAKRGPIKTQSRFDVPARSSTVPVGTTVFAGVAWAPHRGIERVEIRADSGEWSDAELSSPLSDDAWVQWRGELDLAEGVHLVECRATDGTGQTQGAAYVAPRPDGAEGYDVIRVTAQAA